MNEKLPEMRCKILLMGALHFENMGDPLFMMTAKRMLEARGCIVDLADLFFRKGLSQSKPTVANRRVIRSGLFRRIAGKAYRCIRKLPFVQSKRLLRKYRKLVVGYDAVVLPGGGFVSYSRSYPYHRNIRMLELACKGLRIPFCMNAVGVCRDVDRLFHASAWRKILRDPTLCYISCRDGKELIEKHGCPPVEQVGCTATLADELFDIRRDEASDTIGIGVIRSNAFSMYGYDMSEEQLIEFYAELVTALRRHGYHVVLFTNGLPIDCAVAERIREQLGDDTLLLKRPETPEELVRQIASFRAVMCARLHAAITAFALNIPTVLFCWGVKGREFMEMANAADFALPPERMRADVVLPLLERAMNEGWDAERRAAVRRSAEESVDRMLHKINEYNRG